MKKTYLLLLVLFASITAMAGPITPDEARQKITKAMSPRRSAAVLQDLRLVATSHYQAKEDALAPSYYVFNVGKGQGYIIAGADDRIPVVLGYSERGTFDPDNMPVNMQAWLKEYDRQMEYLNQHPEAAAPKRTVSGEAISPLIQAHWNQSAPYNNLCPMDGDQRSLTGCAATAMAQVMYYWQHPNYTTAEIPAYVTDEKKLSVAAVPAGTAIDWANMLPQYSGNETEAQCNAVANLMLICGTALQMEYTAENSGAVTARAADLWKTYFGYDATTTNEGRTGYRTAAWNQKVYDELKASRPVLYYGQSSGGGHAFVIDGYGGDDYFHVNWGWGGDSDDYFLLSILDSDNNSGAGASSSADGYSFNQGAIFGARPDTGIPPTIIPILTTQNVALPSGTEFTRTDVSKNFEFKVGFTFYNGLNDTYTFDWSVGLFSTNDQLLGVINFNYYELPPGWGIWDPKDENAVFSIKFGSGVTNGTYLIKPVSRKHGSEQWYADKGSDNFAVIATISDNTLTLMPPTFGLTGSLEATGKKEVASPLPVNVTITNNGTLFNDQIFLLVNGEMVGGRYFDIDAGQTAVVGFTIVPQTEGVKELSVCTRSWNGETQQFDYTPFITGSVTVEAAVAANLTINGTVENADKDVITENVIKFKATIKNNASSSYENNIAAVLFKHSDDGQYYSIKNLIKPVQIGSSETTSVNYDFDNLEDDSYIVVVYYQSMGKWVMGYQSDAYTVNAQNEPEPKEETGYYLVSDLNGWSTSDKSYAFTKQSDGKTWEITFPGSDKDIFLKVAPGSAYDDQATFWNNLLCATTDRNTALQGTMIKGDAGAWLLEASNNAESYTMRIVPSEMTYEITYQEKEKPFEPQPPYYYIGNGTGWKYDATMIFTDNSDGTYSITVPAAYGDDDKMWFKVAPANAIASDGTITWAHLYSTDAEGSTQLSGTMTIGDGEAWARPKTDGAESYTITITPETKAIVIQPNIPEIVKFTVQAIDVQGTMKTGEEVEMTISVKNEGNVESGKLYVFINDVKTGDIAFTITPGEMKDYKVKYLPTAAGEYTVKITTDEAGQTLAGETAAATKTFTITDREKADPEFAIQANEHFDATLGYFTAKLGQPYNSPTLSNPHNVSPIVWTSSNPSVATVDENGVVTIVAMGGTTIRADFAGNDEYKSGYAEYYLYVSDIINYNTNDDGTVTVAGGDVTGDVKIENTVVINGQTYQVTGITDNAFKGNTDITSVTIPDGITTIGANAFDGCSNMMTIIIGKDVTTIGEKAFANIGTPANAPRRTEGEGIKVECHAENVPTTAANAFEASTISSGTLLVDDNSVMAYYTTEPWSKFGTIRGFNGTEPTAIRALWTGENGTAQIFSLDGRKKAETQEADLVRVLNTLPKGVYIIRVGQKSKTITTNTKR